jgi:hypothetical protein
MLRSSIRLFLASIASLSPSSHARGGLEVAVSFPTSVSSESIDGRLLLLIASKTDPEPRFQVNGRYDSAQVFGIDVNGMAAGKPIVFDSTAFGWPVRSIQGLPAGEYVVQALLHRYETFRPSHGHTVQLPMDRGEGQQWSKAPGNLFSTPKTMRLDPASGGRIEIVLDQVIPPIVPPKDTRYVRHVRIQSDRLSEFWGRPMFLGAHVLVPEGFDEHPDARYPLCIFHGHFPPDFGGFREEPPDPDLAPDYSERFDLHGYNRIMQQEAHAFYETWKKPEAYARPPWPVTPGCAASNERGSTSRFLPTVSHWLKLPWVKCSSNR